MISTSPANDYAFFRFRVAFLAVRFFELFRLVVAFIFAAFLREIFRFRVGLFFPIFRLAAFFFVRPPAPAKDVVPLLERLRYEEWRAPRDDDRDGRPYDLFAHGGQHGP